MFMPFPTEKDLIKSACHFGHAKHKWNPKMAPYLYAIQKGIHIFDLTQTHAKLKEVCAELQELYDAGKVILFVSTKQQSITAVESIGKHLNQPIVTSKWIPGLMTNWNTIKKRLKVYKDLQESFKSGDITKYTKKEQTMLRKKLAKLDIALSGVAHMTSTPDAIFVVDAVHNNVAVREALTLKIPVYGICDSNANPDDFTNFVPANDDAVKSIEIILNTVEEHLLGGKTKKKAETPEEEETLVSSS
ncbi:30S ribosomal protein S2 [Candidatus Peregrinibacteria bacterium CG10_big_fil_rev_8_21_14_0_10_49_16]|nr:MAG: 30S ribosomal protein S2 [Candidatus Peregrinibacteria bacterium CG22_combo_CG10-13_8_21_14_all_49_11]PIR52336.1 MAG: 30S ribosomal protein S2 [Candidatus Peregrinibacteria bacterium CG10_big_fil_rev_8_21_14_0_10_49_16]